MPNPETPVPLAASRRPPGMSSAGTAVATINIVFFVVLTLLLLFRESLGVSQSCLLGGLLLSVGIGSANLAWHSSYTVGIFLAATNRGTSGNESVSADTLRSAMEERLKGPVRVVFGFLAFALLMRAVPRLLGCVLEAAP